MMKLMNINITDITNTDLYKNNYNNNTKNNDNKVMARIVIEETGIMKV